MTTGARLNAAFLAPDRRKQSPKKRCLVCRKILKDSKRKRTTQICSRCQIQFNSRWSPGSWICLINYFGKKVDEAYNKGLEDASNVQEVKP